MSPREELRPAAVVLRDDDPEHLGGGRREPVALLEALRRTRDVLSGKVDPAQGDQRHRLTPGIPGFVEPGQALLQGRAGSATSAPDGSDR